MPDVSLVTLCTPSGTFSSDYELPAHLPVERLSPLLLEALSQQEPRRFGSWKGLGLAWNGQKLGDGDTLSARGIWDGSILTIEEESR